MVIAERGRTYGSLALLFLGILLGGGRSEAFTLVIEVAALALLFFDLGLTVDRAWPARSGLLFGLVALLLLVPIAQLVPLPPQIWAGLPGHAPFLPAVALGSTPDAWRPLSLDPGETLRSLLGFLPGLAMLLVTMRARISERRMLALLLVGLALVSATLGLSQIAAGPRLYLYEHPEQGVPLGLFANRNHAAAFSLIALVLLGAVANGFSREGAARLIAVIVAFLLIVSVFATRSRTGMTLLPVALGGAVLAWQGRARLGKLIVPILIAAAALGIVVGILAATHNSVFSSALARFADIGNDARFTFWRDTRQAIAAFWPWGSGLGTFVPLYQTFENLDDITHLYVNHAHDDYLELALEGGLPAIIVLLCGFGLFGLMLTGRHSRGNRGFRRAGGTGILMLMLHSVTDYPLREFSLSIALGFLAGLLFAPANE